MNPLNWFLVGGVIIVIVSQILTCMKMSQLGNVLSSLETRITKISGEVNTLKEQLADVDLPADATATLERITAATAALDDLNPDAPAPNPNPNPNPAPENPENPAPQQRRR